MWIIWCKSGNVLRFWKGSVEVGKVSAKVSQSLSLLFSEQELVDMSNAHQCRGSGWDQGNM